MKKLQINSTDINSIVFDFDGTLAKLNIDFNQMRRDVWKLISSYGVEEKDIPDNHILETIDFVTRLLSSTSSLKAAEFEHEALDLIERIELAAASNGELFPPTKELLSELTSLDISTAIITRNCRAAVLTVFPDILDYCPVVVCREDVNNVKPHPEHLDKALQITGSKAENSLMIGDHPLDIKAGQNSGTFTAGVLTGNYREEDFCRAGADLILPEAIQILKLIR